MLRRLLFCLLINSLPFLVNTGLWSCKGPCKELFFSADVHDYFLDFKEGSYWIYQNVQNGDIDSVYFVSQNITPEAVPKGDPVCYQESGLAKFKGLANGRFGYYIKSWNNNMENADSDITFQGDYEFDNPENISVRGVLYRNVITIQNCCLSTNCYGCSFKDFRFLRLYFSRQIGLIRWEAENHPQYGNAVYELIRYKALR